MPSPKLDPLLSAAIRCRDRGRCVYCDRAIAAGEVEGVDLEVDHIIPRAWFGERFGLNLPPNLASCCDLCNTLKGTNDAAGFARMVDLYKENLTGKYAYLHGIAGADILARVKAARARPLNYADARAALVAIKANRQG